MGYDSGLFKQYEVQYVDGRMIRGRRSKNLGGQRLEAGGWIKKV
jgi:hypothetical protein